MLKKLEPAKDLCLELTDHSLTTHSAIALFGSGNSRDPAQQAARLAMQFIEMNASIFKLLDLNVRRDYDGSDVQLVFESHSAVGAVPLLSPLTARPDFGLVVQPRFPWSGIGPMLAEMGWLISPAPVRLPMLKRSERRVPPWVLSFMVLTRVKALLDRLERRFESVEDVRQAPKGRVDWEQYAVRYVARGNFLSVPCTFPDLRDDRKLKGAIRYALEKQMRSLETQAQQGSFVHRLISFAETLLVRVRDAGARRPAASEVEGWMRRPMRTDVLVEGLQAIDSTVEDRGLAGLSDLSGLPWVMPMELFFEAWVETVLRLVIQKTGGDLRAGRKKETVSALRWEPSFLSSQRSLVPDLVLEMGKVSVIVDAKYKRHWEEFQLRAWANQDGELREEHRADLMQVLAYANLARTQDVICCLVYPCGMETWESLRRRGRLFHKAELPYHGRRVRVWLTAVPMSCRAEVAGEGLVAELRA